MASSARVTRETINGARFQIKRNQAQGRIDHCLSVATKRDSNGKLLEIKDLTLPEMVAARSEKARLEEGLCYFVETTDRDGKVKMVAKPYFAELPDFEFQLGDGSQVQQELRLAAQANKWAAEATV